MLLEMFSNIMREVLLWLQLCEWKYENNSENVGGKSMKFKKIKVLWRINKKKVLDEKNRCKNY